MLFDVWVAKKFRGIEIIQLLHLCVCMCVIISNHSQFSYKYTSISLEDTKLYVQDAALKQSIKYCITTAAHPLNPFIEQGLNLNWDVSMLLSLYFWLNL